MNLDVRDTALLGFLGSKQHNLCSKIEELRAAVTDWLNYIPHTFPHYTRHTVEHSDAIILQISKALFDGDDPARPVVKLSPMEAYIVCAAAYLHDAGMVTSDRQKAEILSSDSWKEWISEGGAGQKRWGEIQALRYHDAPPDEGLRNFLADVQTRFLIAEFVRRTHHYRAREVMAQHQDRLGLFAFHDPVLLRTISDICVAHGLRQRELEDNERYPTRRDIQGQQVNVRFAAVLLRLGDLLDMSYDRACPLLLSAACPLPAESLAHWSQYQRITHSLTAPDRIEITAECENQEEHRFLTDWCQWLVDELQYARMLVPNFERHRDWQPPYASLGAPQGTIKIEPSRTATYIPKNWRFELDTETVFSRLIHDVYESKHTFVRELIQNALDATRCQIYLQLKQQGLPTPEYPIEVAAEVRSRYPIHVGVQTREAVNPLSGETEKRSVVTVEDSGVGMDIDIIQRYFLQVGRSFYTTSEFRRTYGFVPASRFGLGFLSVFDASDKVKVETYKPTSAQGDGPLTLVLTGPKNYLLIDKGNRTLGGTRIEVVLNEPMKPGHLNEMVSGWCRKAEFPIIVNDFGTQSLVVAERPNEFTYEIPDLTAEDAKFVVRAFDVNRRGIEGHLYVFARVDKNGESWANWSWARYTYPTLDPRATPPPFPDNLYAVHGMTLASNPTYGPAAERLDFRDGSLEVSLSRHSARFMHGLGSNKELRIASRWEELLGEHLKTCERARGLGGWMYKQALADYFPLGTFWDDVPGSVPVRASGQRKALSLAQAVSLSPLVTLMAPRDFLFPHRPKSMPRIQRAVGGVYTPKGGVADGCWQGEIAAITAEEVERLSRGHRSKIFASKSVRHVSWTPSGFLALEWCSRGDGVDVDEHGKAIYLAALPEKCVIGIEIHKVLDDTYSAVLLNSDNEFVQWFLRVRQSSQAQAGLNREQYDRLREMLFDAVRYSGENLNTYLGAWRKMPGLPADLYPPIDTVSQEDFVLTCPNITGKPG